MEVPLNLTQPKPSSSPDSKYKSLADYKVVKEIGEGSFSTVYLGKEKGGSQRDVAIKICLKKQIIRDKRIKYVHREKEALACLSTEENSHPSVVILYATFQDADNLFFVLSYAQYGDLLEIQQRQPNQKFQLHDSKYYSAMLFDAIEHIHSVGVLHRDVKPENILIKSDGRIMLTDFGSAAFIQMVEKEEAAQEGDQIKRRGSFVGTAQYVCPEMLTNKKITIASDYWSFAVCVYQFITGLHAFHDESEYLIFRRVSDALYKFTDDFDSTSKDLIENILQVNPDNRLKTEQIKAHPFFSAIDFSNLQKIEPPKIYLQ